METSACAALGSRWEAAPIRFSLVWKWPWCHFLPGRPLPAGKGAQRSEAPTRGKRGSLGFRRAISEAAEAQLEAFAGRRALRGG